MVVWPRRAPCRWSARPGRRPDHTRRDAGEDGAVAGSWVAGDVLDQLGVVVGGQERFAVAAVGHWDPANEIGEPAVGGGLEFGVLVEEMVDVPALVGYPEVIGLGFGD